MAGISARNSPNRRAPPLRYQMTFGVHARPKYDMHSLRGQAGMGGETPFFRSFVRIDGEWRIIAKVFHFDLKDAM